MEIKNSQYKMTCGEGNHAVTYVDGAEAAWFIFSNAVTYARKSLNEFPVRLYDNENDLLIAEVIS